MITADWTHESQPVPAVGDTVCRLGDAGLWQVPDDDDKVMAVTEALSGCKWQFGTLVMVDESVDPPRVGIEAATK